MKRRSLLELALLSAIPSALPRTSQAMDRIAAHGSLRLSVPLGLQRIDPHVLEDIDAAFFAGALFDALYATDETSGRPYATLAEGLPEVTSQGLLVRLRSGLRASDAQPLLAADFIETYRRILGRSAAPLLQGFSLPSIVRTDERAALFKGKFTTDDALRLASLLSSPLTALVPRHFSPERPLGTGPFRARSVSDGLLLERNPLAARGPAYLDSVVVRRARSLADALRAYESGAVDVGWLAKGLHQARRKSVSFEGPAVGLVLLQTGSELTTWNAPGVAQTVLDHSQLTSLGALGVGPVPGRKEPLQTAPWRGPEAPLLVAGDSPQLVAIAHSLVEILGGRERGLSVRELSPTELNDARKTQKFHLLLDFVRRPSTLSRDDVRALSARAGVNANASEPLLSFARRVRFGVVGALHVSGASLGGHVGLDSWNFGDLRLAKATART